MLQSSANFRERIYSRYVSSGELVNPDLETLQTRAPALRKLIRDYFPANRDAAIIDIGCGHGALLHFAREAGYRTVEGVDISAEQVAAAARLGIGGVSYGDLFETLRSLATGSRDLVVTFDVIEHFRKEELVEFADEIFRVLRDRGTWIIHAPNGGSPLFGRIFHGDFTHEQAFTRSSLEQLAFAVGFKELVCREDAPIPHGLSSSLRWLVWKAIRCSLLLWLTAETGAAGPKTILTQNLVAVARK
jgi:cyclopropane fatty-acyl-phospholipid synthase-like methyltransferase